MLIVTHHLGHGSSFDLPARPASSKEATRLALVVGGGRGCALRAQGPIAGLFIPLRGRLQLGSATGGEATLVPGELRVTEPEPRVHAVGRGNAVWAAVLGAPVAWRRALGPLIEIPTPEPLLLPARHAADRDFRRKLIALVRSAPESGAELPLVAADAIFDRVLTLQTGFAAAIARCPGRTYAQRRQVFLRLQRVRNYLGANCHLDVDNDTLARMASYSPWHFIRAFRAAYQETPHAYLVRQRLERARRLLRESPLAIAEIALASGFENRCAFSRLFRQRFGTTAGAIRRESGAAQVPRAS